MTSDTEAEYKNMEKVQRLKRRNKKWFSPSISQLLKRKKGLNEYIYYKKRFSLEYKTQAKSPWYPVEWGLNNIKRQSSHPNEF